MNPFELEVDDNLYCLSTGKDVSNEIKIDLLNSIDIGKRWCQEFVDGCFNDAARFEKPIPRRKVLNFASAAVKTSIKSNSKIVELQGTKDLFGRLLYLSSQNNIDLARVFTYPLTPVPLSLAHVDGSINKTDKAKLLHKLENTIRSTGPEDPVDVTLVDGMFLLHTLQNLPTTYGEVASVILALLCNMSNRVDMICDTYREPSIKDLEHSRRSADDSMYSITGPSQQRPKNWQKALQSSRFKTALVKFLVQEWSMHADPEVLKGHDVFLAVEDVCHHYMVQNGQVIHDEVPALAASHEEADTRIVFHLSSLPRNEEKPSVVVRCSDTDVLVLLLHHVSVMDEPPLVWMDTGRSSNNTRRFINVTQLVNHLDAEVLDALPALHAFTGTDFTAAFMNKGKVRPYEIMLKSQQFTKAFAKLGRNGEVSEATLQDIEKFTCTLYGLPKLTKVDDVRLALFEKKYSPKQSEQQPLDKIRRINPNNMPPCHSVLSNKIKTANYVTHIWKNASKRSPCELQPEEHGWLLKEGMLKMNWFDGDQLPENILNIVTDCDLDDEADESPSFSSDESDSDDEY